MKIASVVGARPNFVKLAPLSREIRKRFEETIIHTGQHYDYEMDRIFFQELGIPDPDYHLGVGSSTHGAQTAEMLKKIEEIFISDRPDLALVFGDTNTTLAGALAATKLHIPLAHVEAGLRSFNKWMPEEVNRVLVDHCSDLLFSPTKTAFENLKNEGIIDGIYLTGDVMADILLDCLDIAEKRSDVLADLNLNPGTYRLATVHRAENTDDPENLKQIIEALTCLNDVVFPCHPRTEGRLKEQGLWDRLNDRVRVIKPVGYLEMLVLESKASQILTDSGGVQKEAYMLKVPCITLREQTEWVETIQDGWNVLTGADKGKILHETRRFRPYTDQRDVFGEEASKKIVRILTDHIQSIEQ
jgi:UDP-N-acetylglucosamine 2-epimerase